MRWIHRAAHARSRPTSPRRPLAFDRKAVKVITIIGIPSAFLLHGYVGFIFGSIKANPVVEQRADADRVPLLGDRVRHRAGDPALHGASRRCAAKPIDMACLDKLASFLFYALIVDFSLEMLDFIHRLYESEESIKILSAAGHEQAVHQPDHPAGAARDARPARRSWSASRLFERFNEELRKLLYFVVGDPDPDRHLQHALERRDRRPAVLQEPPRPDDLQDGAPGHRGTCSPPIALLLLPFFVLAVLLKLLPPWETPAPSPAPGRRNRVI